MANAVPDGQSRRDDLAKLASAADQLAGGLAQLDTTLGTALAPLTAILTQAQSPAHTFNRFRPQMQQLGSAASGNCLLLCIAAPSARSRIARWRLTEHSSPSVLAA